MKDAFKQRFWPGDGVCDHCGNRFTQKFGLDVVHFEPWILMAPDLAGMACMPGESLIVGEWCDKECFEHYLARLLLPEK